MEKHPLIAECENGDDNINMKCYKQANKNVSFRIMSVIAAARECIHLF